MFLDKTCQVTFQRMKKSSLVSSSNPQSIATGDINNDHHIDIIVANSGTNTIGIFISNVDGTFQNQQIFATGSQSRLYSLVIRDFNHDQNLDIAVAYYDTNSIHIFLGYGNGTFRNQLIFSLGSSHPLFLTAGDVNNDNHTDLIVANYDTDSIGILLGYGNGSFEDQKIYSTGYDSHPCSIGVGDFNRDNHSDLAVSNYGTNNIGILFGYGNGTFANQITYTTTHQSNPSSLILEDFNNDDRLDIAVSHNGIGTVGIFFGQENGSFLLQTTYSIGSNSHPQYITIGYFDQDNISDLAIIDSINNQIHILRGYRDGRFATPTTYDAIYDSYPIWLSIVDVNNNNQSDLVVANYGLNNVLVLMDYFVEPSTRQTNYGTLEDTGTVSLAIGDFNNDSFLDIVYNAEGIFFILNGFGNGSFNGHAMYSIGSTSISQYMCVGDLNNDNHTDIISANRMDGYADIFIGYGNGSFDAMMSYSTGIGSKPQWVALGDVNNDNVLDVISANTGSHSIGILLGNGDGSFATVLIFSTHNDTPPHSVVVGNTNNDNHLDLVVVDKLGWVTIYLGFGNGSFIFWNEYAVNTEGYYIISAAHADFNSDNRLDIVVANTFFNNIGVLLGYGNGTFTAPKLYSTGSASQPYYVIVADFNNDNLSDIAATNHGNDEIVILYGDGNGNFEIKRTYSTGFGSKPYGIIAADFNNDKNLEIAVTLWGIGKLAVLIEYEAAKFVNHALYPTGSALHSVSIATADFNNDNRTDAVVVNSGTDNLHVLFGSNNGTFATNMTYAISTNSQPQYVITCDINKDNCLDIVTVNSKANSISVILGYGNSTFAKQMIYSTGTDSYPSAVVAADMNNDHRLDLVVANERTDEIGIFYAFEYTSFHDQVTYQSTNDRYPCKLVVNDFNNDYYLDVAVLFYGSDSFGIAFGYGNGSFTDIRRYSTETDSQPFGIATEDFNKDSCFDIIVANTNNDRISVFLGYGNGSFAPMMAYSTGYQSTPVDIAIGDCNNDLRLDIIVVNYFTHSVGVFLGHGNGSFAIIKTYLVQEGFFPFSISVGDFSNDSNLDIAVVSRDTYSVAVLLGYGDGTFRTSWTWSTDNPSIPYWISVGDFNSDDQLDIVIANRNNNNIGILLGYGNGIFDNTMQFYSTGAGSFPRCISVGDYNNDMILDIAVANFGTNDIVILFGQGDGSFLLGKPYSTGLRSGPWGLMMGDFNNDSRLDIAVALFQSNNLGIFLNYDIEPFGSMTQYSCRVGSKPHSAAVGDINEDGWLDIVVANYGTDDVGIFLGSRDRTFQYTLSYSTRNGSAPYSLVLADVNNDNHLDFVVTGSETNTINIFLGDGNGTFVFGEIYSAGTRSRPYTLTIADFNNDHLLDIAVVNSGTSNLFFLYGYGNGTFGNETSYTLGYGYHPYSIAAKDLNQDHMMDIVIACYDTDHIETFLQTC